MFQALGPIVLALCANSPANAAPQNPLLAAAPADSIFVASCDDPSALRVNLLSHQMVRLFDGGSGTPYVTAITDMILSEANGDEALAGFEFAKRFAESFDGPIVAFANKDGFGFLTSSPSGGGDLRTALDQILTQMPKAEIKDQGSHQGFQLRSIKPEGRGRGMMIRAEAPGLTGIFMGEGDVLASAQDSVQRYTAQVRSDIEVQLTNARLDAGSKGSRSAIDFMFDLSRAMRMSGEDVSQVGLDQDSWIYGRIDIGGPAQAEGVVELQLPQGGVISTFLDVLKPVTKEDLARIPSSALSFHAMRIDLELVLEKLIEVGGAEAEDQLETVRATTVGATGRDLIDELFLGMTGSFATYEFEPPQDPVDIASLISGQGVISMGVHDSEEMLEVFDDLISLGGLDSMVDFQDYKDVELWIIDIDGVTPGVAFMDGQLLFAVNPKDLERVIDHATTPGSQSVLDGMSGRQLTEYGSGGFYVSYQDTALAAWKMLAQGALAAELAPELRFLSNTPNLNLDDVKREVSGSTISSFLRTAQGLMFRAESR
ncbi:MAG: hypothetical protein OSB14_09085 [Planctomycetota bacterium]|nr:hypothetical protein [Planctomycetota bacterium]